MDGIIVKIPGQLLQGHVGCVEMISVAGIYTASVEFYNCGLQYIPPEGNLANNFIMQRGRVLQK